MGVTTIKQTRKHISKIIQDHGDWIEVDASTQKHPTAIMKIDKSDWEMLQSIGVGRVTAFETSNIYATWNKYIGNRRSKTVLVHRILFPGSQAVDHINHDGLDNRRSNIRPCTNSQNMMNRGPQSNNKSGIKGVSFCIDRGKWKAEITVNGKYIFIGRYDLFNDAVIARKDAEKKYHGDFAP